MNADIFMRRAISLSCEGVAAGGGPFGAVIVRDGTVIAEGRNQVTGLCDPTAHAEVMAIRTACQALGRFDLRGCEIFSSCEPCPMCLAAIYWARLDRITFGNGRQDAATVGFDDDFLYRELPLPIDQRSVPTTQHLRTEALVAFDAWAANPDRVSY